MSEIFVSYSRKDKDVVFPFVERINKELNLNCWIDLKGIKSGEEFEDVIIENIDNCQVVLFMLSDASLKSKFTKREVYYAEDEGKRIVPVLIDGDKLRGWFKFHFGNVDYIDIRSDEQKDKLIRNLKSWLGVAERCDDVQQEAKSDQNSKDNAEKTDRLAKFSEMLSQAWREKEYSSQMDMFSRLMKEFPEDEFVSQSYFNRGYFLEKSGDLNSAIMDYKEAVLYDQNNAEAFYRLGSVLVKDDKEQSIVYLKRSIELSPDKIKAYYVLGLVYETYGTKEAYLNALDAYSDGKRQARFQGDLEMINQFEKVIKSLREKM